MAPIMMRASQLQAFSLLFISMQFQSIRKENTRKRKLTSRLLLENFRNWNCKAGLCFQLVLLAFNQQQIARPISRSCRRLPRLQGWWDMVWYNFDDKRFKTNFRVTKGTFLYIFGELEDLMTREAICEEPVPPMTRLAVCLYRLARGDYLHTIGELVGLGTSTVSVIVQEVCSAMVSRLWKPFVEKNMPKTLEELKESMTSFDELWQFPYSFGAVDGCHLPMKCPKGGLESANEYHNFKNFYSIVIMAIVDAKTDSCGQVVVIQETAMMP